MVIRSSGWVGLALPIWKEIEFKATTLSRLASITKSMTAIAIMQLYESGLLELDESIQTYLPGFPMKRRAR
ncbi:MAG: serine hydrolase [Saprospiraceae bacterium]|nr:serine hydrolase [Saprospiraceae bacterium]